MLSRIAALISAFIILLGNIPTSKLPDVPEPASQQELAQMTTYLKPKTVEDTIYVIDTNNMPTDEKSMLVCLEGIVNRTSPCLFVVITGGEWSYIQDLEKAGKAVMKTDGNGNAWTTHSIMEKFRDRIGDGGYCVYKETDLAEGLNVATNYATLYGWLPVSERLMSLAESFGLTMKKDLRTYSDMISLQKNFFEENRDKFSKDAVVHINTRMISLRDLAIQQGFYCFYTDIDKKGLKYLGEVLDYMGINTAVLGWVEEEKKGVATISSKGCWLNPTDRCTNNSILAFIDNERLNPEPKKGTAATDDTKHYICLLYSDGDNCQWIQNGYGEYFNTRKYYPDIPMSWTFSPFIKDFCPSMFNRAVLVADDNNQFAGGPSGIGYCNLSRFPVEALDGYATLTAAAMKRSGQNVLVSLDDYTTFKDSKMQYALSYFSRFENIDGGLLYLDPDCYRAGRGKIWFCDDKPFVSVRLSLWCRGGYPNVTEEWVKEQADVINSYPADIHSVNGYSLICVQAWTMETEWTQVFIDNLGENVEILNASDFIATITENVPHQNAVPDTSSQWPVLK